jgi:2-hydroxymuconate-semialdehyde hydrolase
LLLLHGSGPGVSAWSNWRLVYPELSRSHRVIAPDQVGFNKTLPPPGVRYGRSMWTTHALSLMETLEIERFDVIGNSMGGAVALSMAARRPDAIGRIVVMGTMGISMELPEGLDEAWGYEPSPEAMRSLLRRFVHDKTSITEDLVDMRYRASLAPGLQESFSAMFPAPRQAGVDDLALSNEELTALRHPILLVHGYADEIIPFERSSLPLMDVLPNADLVAFGRCGHWVMIERTEAFNRTVLSFLDAP